MPSLSQDALIRAFKKYYLIQKEIFPERYNETSDKFLEKISYGICSGLSSAWILFGHLNKEDEFINLVDKITSWNLNIDSLTDDLKKDFEYFFSIADFLQYATDTDETTKPHDEDILENSRILSNHNLDKNISTCFNSNKEQLKIFLNTALHDGTYAQLSGLNHVVAIHRKGDLFFLYDPNQPSGIISGSLDEVIDTIFKSIALPAGYKHDDIVTITLDTYEDKSKMNARKILPEMLDSLHESAGHYSEDNKYSSTLNVSPLLVLCNKGDTSTIKRFLLKQPTNLFKRFKKRNYNGSYTESDLATILLLSNKVPEILKDIIELSEKASELEKINFIMNNIYILDTLTDEQIFEIIQSLKLSYSSQKIIARKIANSYLDEAGFKIFKNLQLSHDIVIHVAIKAAKEVNNNFYLNMFDHDIIKHDEILAGKKDNVNVFGSFLHLTFNMENYEQLVNRGANQFQKNHKGKLAIDSFLQKVEENDCMNDILTQISRYKEDSIEPPLKDHLLDFILVLFMSDKFIEDKKFSVNLVKELIKLPDVKQHQIFSRLIARDDVSPKTLDSIITNCKNKSSLEIVASLVKENRKLYLLSDKSIFTIDIYCNAKKATSLPTHSSAPARKRAKSFHIHKNSSSGEPIKIKIPNKKS